MPFGRNALSLVIIAILSTATAHAATDEPIHIGSRLELMVDDFLIDHMSDSTVLELHHRFGVKWL